MDDALYEFEHILCGPLMPRPRQRVCLEQGLKLDLNKLRRQRLVRPGMRVGPKFIPWTNSYTAEEIAIAIDHCRSRKPPRNLQIQIGNLNQCIDLVTQTRRLGGQQWYFQCPVNYRPCSVLWMLPGTTRFCSRQSWGRHVAYSSQFATPGDRAHLGKAKIKSRLIGTCDPDQWDLPPKPKWMRWRTYKKQVEKFDRYEEALDRVFINAAVRLSKGSWS